MTPEREIDIQVAEAMGLTLDYEFAEMYGEPRAPELRDHYDEWGVLPDYSTDLTAAWHVIEWQRKQWPQTVGKPAKYWQFASLRDDLWSVMIREENATVARVIARDSGPFPLAVCRCFLAGGAPQGES